MPTLTDQGDRHTIIDRRKGQYICFPDVVQAGDGRLIVVYNEADKHIAPTRRTLLTKTSFDNGKSWGEIRTMDVNRSHCPRLTRFPDGELVVIDSSRTFHRSMDNGETWETSQTSGLTHDMFDRIVDLGDDIFLTTGHLHRGSFPHPAIRQAPTEQMVYCSKDRGLTWSPLSVLAHHRNLVLCEASMLRLPDGRIIALMRENSFVYEPM